jgi:hypothetical protein
MVLSSSSTLSTLSLVWRLLSLPGVERESCLMAGERLPEKLPESWRPLHTSSALARWSAICHHLRAVRVHFARVDTSLDTAVNDWSISEPWTV